MIYLRERMKREDIEKAANYGMEEYVNENKLMGFRGSYRRGFMDGAEWRISDIWHDASEAPKKKGYILVWVNSEHPIFVTWNINVIPTNWAKTVKINNVVKWAYIKDLLPNTEE